MSPEKVQITLPCLCESCQFPTLVRTRNSRAEKNPPLLLWCFQTHFANQRGLDQNLNFVHLSKLLLNLFHMCDLCCVLLPGVTNMTTRKKPFKQQEEWASLLDPVFPASKMYRQTRCTGKVNAATQALWKSIWKIFNQIPKQVSTHPFHQNFPICSAQPLSLERGLQWLAGLLPSFLLQPRRCDLWAQLAEHRHMPGSASPAPLLQPPGKG